MLPTRRHNNDLFELEVKTDTQPLAPHGSQSTGKQSITMLAGETNPKYHGEIKFLLRNKGKE